AGLPRRASGSHTRAARTALLSRGAAVHRRASRVVARPAGEKGVLHGRADRAVVYATLEDVPGRVGGLVPAPAARRRGGRTALVAEPAPPRGARPARSLRGDGLSRVFPAGAVSNSRNRSGPDRVRGPDLRGPLEALMNVLVVVP